MMERVAVSIDAGYLFAQGSVALTGMKQGPEYLSLSIPDVLAALQGIATQQTQLPLLRVYWYDAMRLGRPTTEQMALSDSADIKIRLWQVNAAGEQKGVDALIVTDMAELARNRVWQMQSWCQETRMSASRFCSPNSLVSGCI